jgi:hypothetical protein
MPLADITIGGLPSHPLLVHFAIVLVPPALIALAATGWRADWRRRYALPVLLLAIGGAVACYLAAISGPTLGDSVIKAELTQSGLDPSALRRLSGGHLSQSGIDPNLLRQLAGGQLPPGAASTPAVPSQAAPGGAEALDPRRAAVLRTLTTTRPQIQNHQSEGDVAKILAIAFAVVAAGVWAIDVWGPRFHLPAWTPLAGYALGVSVGIAAVVYIVLAGHSGSALVWKDVGNFVAPR